MLHFFEMALATYILHSAFYFGVFIVTSSAFRIASFNTGLASTVPYLEDRREEIAPALEELNADILCLQEVMIF